MHLRRLLIPAVAASALLVTAGCGGGSSSDRASAAGGVDRDATLTVALNYLPTTLDPHTATSPMAGHVFLSPFYDRLTEIGDGMKPVPMLATGWEFSDGGTEVTFELRRDATFWDGTQVDAKAVKASLDRAMTLEGSTVAPALALIESVEADGEQTVVIKTKRPAADLPSILAGVEGSIINPTALENPDLDLNPVGSGPYRLESQTGDTLTLTRVEGYRDPEAQEAAKIEIIGMPNDNTRLAAFRTGQVDMMMTTLGQFGEVERLGEGFEVYEYPAASTYTVFMNTGLGELADEKVRQALNWAIDREAISETLLNGKCEPSGQLLGKVYEGHLDSPPVNYNYDPEKAKELLKEAGVEPGFSVDILVPAGLTLYEKIITSIQAQFKEVGVETNVSPQESSTIFTNWASGDKHGGFMNARATKPTAGMTLEAAYINPARFPGPLPEGFRELINKTQDPNLSPEEIKRTAEEANALAVEQALDVYICSAPAVWAAKDTVVGADSMSLSNFSTFGDLRYVGIGS